jgi:hypothetical protein
MTCYSRLFSSILIVALAACSGGTAPTGANSAMPPSPARAFGLGRIHTRIHIPLKKKTRLRAIATRGKMRPHWLPSSATEIDFQLIAVNGSDNNIGWCNVGQGSNCFNFTIYTTGSGAGGCSSDGNGGLYCNVSEPAPAAADTYQIQAQYCTGKLNADGSCGAPDGLALLSQAQSTIQVPLNGTASGNFTLDPVVASLQWSASDIGVGSGQPFATGTLPGHPIVQIQALDDYGDVIIGATTDPNGNYNTALYLQWNGDVDTIYWNCSDPSVQFETGGGPYSNLSGFTPLSAETVANGYYAGSYDAKHHGKMHPKWDGAIGINSPEADPQNDYDGGHWGVGIDGNGNPVQGVGNNGTEINYDGSTPLDLSTEFDCNAYDDEGNQATLAVTLGNGTITWTNNSRRRARR